jgi:hypothetical protein
MVTKLPCKLTKGHTMSTTNTELPKETLAEQYLPTTPTIPNICQPGDKECIARLVQAFSDCD